MTLSSRRTLIVCAIAALSLGFAPAAYADGPAPDTVTGGDVDDGTFTTSQQGVDKLELAREYAAVNEGVGDRARLESLVERYAEQYGGMEDVSPGNPNMTPQQFAASAETMATTRILNLTQYGQQRSYWCGPASAYMIMKYLGILRSRYAGYEWGLSQNSFASVPYLKTERYGATRFAYNVMAPALNHWRQNRAVGYYVQVAAANMHTGYLGNAMLMGIAGTGMPVSPATVERVGSRYNGHGSPGRVIGHWLVGYGYSDAGYEKGYFADPATTVWATVDPKFVYSTHGFQTYFIKRDGNGLVW